MDAAKLVFLFFPYAILAQFHSLPSYSKVVRPHTLPRNFSLCDRVNTREGLDICGPIRLCRLLHTVEVRLLICPTPAGSGPIHATGATQEQGKG